jgi:hypothetical protein
VQAVSTTAGAQAAVRDTATYASPALRAIITEASRLNRRVPPGLDTYRAQMESEIVIGSQRPERGEFPVSVEQVASELTWSSTGVFEQRVTGYRSQAVGMRFASIGFFRNAWAVPFLYGNRLALLFGRDSNPLWPPVRGARIERSTVYAIHPLAEDRERVYRYRGGDTVQVLRVNHREVPIVRVDVEPRDDVPGATVLFTGEVDLDAGRKHVVRMRGYFVYVSGRKPRPDPQAIAFVDLVNSEVESGYWLPSYQRFETQATPPLIGDTRAMFRIVSRFRSYEITARGGAVRSGTPALVDTLLVDTLRQFGPRLSFVSPDSMRRFTAWRTEMGTLSLAVAATDFDDIAPDPWRSTGPPRTTLRPERLYDVAHVNRIEGLWTGIGVTRQFRDQVPGLTLHALAGYAWQERAVRGRAIAEYQRSRMRWGLRAGRSLDITNDFRASVDTGNATSALFGIDDHDYVDRRFASLSAARLLPDRFAGQVRLDVGVADDRKAQVSMPYSPFGRKLFRPNRGSLDGRYARTSLTASWRPDLSRELLRIGVGGRLYYERGDGELNYQRVELRLTARWIRGRFTVLGRGEVGQVFGSVIPPQQLFELGNSQALPGYRYKEYAGDRAALFRGTAIYGLNAWAAPIRLSHQFWLPSPSPALVFGVQAGWTMATNDAARTALAGLNATSDTTALALQALVSRPSDRVRTTLTGGVRFFGGAVALLVARPLNVGARARLLLTLGRGL